MLKSDTDAMSPRDLRHASEWDDLHPNQTIFLIGGGVRPHFPQKP
jgi:hypothetical protein